MNEIWWEAKGVSVVTVQGGHTISTRATVLFEAANDRSVAFAEGVYTLALRGLEGVDPVKVVSATVSQLMPRPELPTSYYLGLLKENFEQKGLRECADELAEYTQYEVADIARLATDFLQDIVDAMTTPNSLVPTVVWEWFDVDAPEGDPFDGFRQQIATWTGNSL